uniref:Glutamine synthetase n=1 Tax=Panagrolaimus superbus TaxID=310955 RepID=A0A914YET6_9BILA
MTCGQRKVGTVVAVPQQAFIPIRGRTDVRGKRRKADQGQPDRVRRPALRRHAWRRAAQGKMFDGSSIAGWKGIAESDMVLLPDTASAYVDPFYADPTIVISCDILDPATMQPYGRCPRGIAKRAEAYLKSSGIAETAFFGPEPEFFIFDSVRFANEMGHTFFQVDSEEAAWNSGAKYDGANSGYRPGVKAATSRTLVQKADELLRMKYVIKNVAHRNGKTVTFMPKPIVGDNGSGMHVHQSLSKGGTNLFSGDGYGGLSQLALWYIGGIFKHAKAINAFANSGTNSYKRLVPGYEAPVMLAYSARNRSASCRIPWVRVTSPSPR